MYFTLLFYPGSGSAHLAYDLVYHPTVIWCKEGEWLVNNRGVHYQVGYLDSLLKKEKEQFEKIFRYDHDSKKVRIICHYDAGYGERECLQNIIQDLTNHSFSIEVISEPDDDYRA
jgi:hypothetical protein